VKLRVAVVYGGRSGEHEISLRSAESIVAALDPARYQVQRFLIGKDGRWSPRPILPEPGANPGIDVVFPVLHGTFGEDGTIQGLLEMAGNLPSFQRRRLHLGPGQTRGRGIGRPSGAGLVKRAGGAISARVGHLASA